MYLLYYAVFKILFFKAHRKNTGSKINIEQNIKSKNTLYAKCFYSSIVYMLLEYYHLMMSV